MGQFKIISGKQVNRRNHGEQLYHSIVLPTDAMTSHDGCSRSHIRQSLFILCYINTGRAGYCTIYRPRTLPLIYTYRYVLLYGSDLRLSFSRIKR